MSLQVNINEKAPGVYSIVLSGSLTSDTYMMLDKQIEKILDSNPKIIVFDMKSLNFISSVGLRILFKTRKILKENMLMVNLQPQIQEVFDIVKALPKEQVFKNLNELDDYLLARQHMNIEERKQI